jgi:hypothetical protein
MYLVIDKIDKQTIVHVNLHPVEELVPSEVYFAYDSDKHHILFVEVFNSETQCVENLQVVELTMKKKFARELITESQYRLWLEGQVRIKYVNNFQNILYSHMNFTHDDNTTHTYVIGNASYLEWVDQQRLRILGTNQGASWLATDGNRYEFSNSEFIRFSDLIFDRGKDTKISMDSNIANIPSKSITELEGLI